jgi:L-lactate dehydrogenase
MYKNKVVLVGAGMVGSAILYTMLTLDNVAEVVVIDKNMDRALGEALDASHTTSFAYSPNTLVRTGTFQDCKDAQIVIVSAGPSVKQGEKGTRLSLAKINIQVMEEIMKEISVVTQDPVIIMVSNPVDILTYYAQNYFDYPKEKIIGTGTLLDTARMRRLLGEKYLVDTKNVHGYVLGEHGETAFCAWSLVNIAGIPLNNLDAYFNSDSPLDLEVLMDEVKNVGYEILTYKGYTNFGIATSVGRIAKAIFLNELSVLPISTTLQGEYGIEHVALSIPCVISNKGIEKTLEVPLEPSELEALKLSANHLKENLKALNL